MKRYKFDKDRGIVDEADNQVLQLVGGTNKFRKLCGTLLAERLNVKARGDATAQAGEATLCEHGKGHCQCDNTRCRNYCD